MIEGIRKILSDENIKEMACKYTRTQEEYEGFILGCNVLSEKIEDLVKNYSLPDLIQQRELLLAFAEYCCNLEFITPNYEVLDENINDFLASNCG